MFKALLASLLLSPVAFAGTCEIQISGGTIDYMGSHTLDFSLMTNTGSIPNEIAKSTNKSEMIALGQKLVSQGVCSSVVEHKYGCTVGIKSFNWSGGGKINKNYSFSLSNLENGSIGPLEKEIYLLDQALLIRDKFIADGLCAAKFDFPRFQCTVGEGPEILYKNILNSGKLSSRGFELIGSAYAFLKSEGECDFPEYDLSKNFTISAFFDQYRRVVLKADSGAFSKTYTQGMSYGPQYLLEIGKNYVAAKMAPRVMFSGLSAMITDQFRGTGTVAVQFGVEDETHNWNTDSYWKGVELPIADLLKLKTENGLKMYIDKGTCELRLQGSGENLSLWLNGAQISRAKSIDEALESVNAIKALLSNYSCNLN